MRCFTLLIKRRGITTSIWNCFSIGLATRRTLSFDTVVNRDKVKQLNIEGETELSRLQVQDLDLKYKPRLVGRKYLPGSEDGGFPEFLAGPQESFPVAYRMASDAGFDVFKCGQLCRRVIDRDLPQHFALLFRGLPLRSVEDFSEFLNSVGYETRTEGVTGYRTSVAPNVETASDDPKEYSMELHNDGSYYTHPPRKIFLFCLRGPEIGAGGETVLAKTRELTQRLDYGVKQKFERLGVRYQATLPNKDPDMKQVQKAWQDRFLTNDPQKVEEILSSRGYEFVWGSNSTLRYWYKYPAFISHPDTEEKLWFNQITAGHASYFKAHPAFEGVTMPDDNYPFHCYYGDGSDIELAVLQHIRSTAWSCAVGFKWLTGDVMVVDNVQALHGRMSWTGERVLLASLTVD